MVAKSSKPANPIDRIAGLVGERDRLREQRDLVNASPRSLEEAISDIPKTIELLASRVDHPVGYLASGPAGYADLAHTLGTHSPNEYAPRTAEAAIAWIAPELLRAAIQRDLERLYEGLPAAMPAPERAVELKRIETEIGRIEGEITAAWWSATDGGMQLAVPDVSGPTLIGLS